MLITDLAGGPYRAILADPPWQFLVRSDKGKGRSAERHYDCMTLADIKRLPVADVAAKDCMLFLWVTDPMLRHGMELLDAWGFTFKTVGFYWVKQNRSGEGYFTGMGYYTRCLDPAHHVYVEHKISKKVQRRTLGSLRDDWSSHRIWSDSGWKEIQGYSTSEHTTVTKINTTGRSFVCSSNHRWAVKRLKTEKLPDGKRNRCHVEDEMTTQEIQNRLEQRQHSTNLLFSRRPMEGTTPMTSFDTMMLSYDLGWLIGLFIAEGNYHSEPSHSSIRWSLGSHETEVITKLSQVISSLGLRNERYFRSSVRLNVFHSKKANSVACYCSSQRLKDVVQNFVSGNTAKTKRLVLENLLNAPIAFRDGVLDGYLTGDGTKTKHGYKDWRKASSCNRSLLEDFEVLAESIGVLAYVDSRSSITKSKICRDTECFFLNFASYREGRGLVSHLQPIRNRSWSTHHETRELVDITVEGSWFNVDGVKTHNSNPEQCWIATRGRPTRLSKGVRRLIISPRREHSRKPDETRPRIEALTRGPYLELFARSTVPGWQSWGNERDKFAVDVDPGKG